ncbi:hypothetical protein [Aliikangiella coralliicola]|uniref:Uncharacterized protein n=1 Tax=Aliikangiella coralliicola TaxID=2592383 RepID=A0A545U076_9GAMM|nr:hypothetical protein [Aliikangiella coralliicola]TQV82867.1 hypothetical protein FLL46_24160 [Aliikangiella coralliicola]
MDRLEYMRLMNYFNPNQSRHVSRINDGTHFGGGAGIGYYGGGQLIGPGDANRRSPYNPISNARTINYHPNSDAADINADLIRAEYEDYRQRYLPLEIELMRLASDPEEKRAAINRAGDEVNSGFESAAKQSAMTAQRYGIRDPSLRVGAERNRNLSKSAAIAQAKNQTRVAHNDLQMRIMAGSHNNSSNSRLSGG